MSDIGIAMVGCGQIANAHLKALDACNDAALAFCVDVDADRAKTAAESHGNVGSSADFEEALNHSSVDAVVLCLPHDLHLPFTLQALSAGKHVLVEKPMALNAEEAREMVSAAEAADRNLMVGQSTRFQPAFQEARRQLDAGRIGAPVNVARQSCFWVERLSTDWRRDVDACGGLYLPLFGSHDVDAMLWLLDDTPDAVSAAIRSGSDLSGGDVEGWIGLTFEDGKVASISFSLRSREARQVTLVVGTDGAMSIGRNSLSIDGEEVSLVTSKGAFQLQMEEFVSSIVEDRSPSVPGSHGARTMQVLDLARMSSEQKCRLVFDRNL
jgi:predicted dehydrogenase